jgi:hypothetical protein
LYCCEIWGLESALKCKEYDPYELLHTKFMKEILRVHCKTPNAACPNAACRSELTRQPCRTKIIMACIKYLDHVISSKDTLSHDILKATWKSNVWIRNIISCINRLGFSFLNEIMPTTSFKPFINQIQQRIYDQILQDQKSKNVKIFPFYVIFMMKMNGQLM